MTATCEPIAEATSPVLALGPEMTIAYAAELRETLLGAAMASEGDLLLDLGGVSDFDSSGVQLLLSARLSLQAQGRALPHGLHRIPQGGRGDQGQHSGNHNHHQQLHQREPARAPHAAPVAPLAGTGQAAVG